MIIAHLGIVIYAIINNITKVDHRNDTILRCVAVAEDTAT